MDKKLKKTVYISGALLTGTILTTVLLIRRRKKRQSGSANILNTNNNKLPLNFKNWNGGTTYLSDAPRGIRNNNPGNLIHTDISWQGKLPEGQNKDRRFEMFIAPVYGVRAMIKDLKNDIRKGKNTVPLLVEEYSPRFENNTGNYINTVCKDLKVSKTAKLLPAKNTLKLLVISMSRVETGGNYVTDELFDRAYALI